MEESMKLKELLRYRVKLFRDAANWKKPARVPHFCNAVTWKVLDAGYELPVALTDFTVMEQVMKHFFSTYRVDGVMDYGIRNQFNVTDAFDGEHAYYYYDENAVGVKDHAHCTVDDLDALLDNPQKYLWEVALPKKYPGWYDKTVADWQNAFDEYIKYFMFILKMSDLATPKGRLRCLSR